MRLLGEEFLGNTRVWFLACSSFLPLTHQAVLEFLVDWVAAHCRSRRRKLAVQNHTPTLLHINRRGIDSLRDRILYSCGLTVMSAGGWRGVN